jgi:hypothetical protein
MVAAEIGRKIGEVAALAEADCAEVTAAIEAVKELSDG